MALAFFVSEDILKIFYEIKRKGRKIFPNNCSLLPIFLEAMLSRFLFPLPQGKVSQPIAGDNGVYVIQVTQKDIAPALPNYSSYMAPLRNQKLNRASQDLFSALEATADIKDNRAKFY